jgi:hypothetical protein
LSKNNNEIKASTRDTRFVPKVRLTTKFAYVSVEVHTKGRVSFNLKLHRTITKIEFGFPLSNPPQMIGQYKRSDAHHNLGGFPEDT